MRYLLLALFLCLPCSPALAQSDDIRSVLEQLPPREMDEVVWLARCMYSETNRPYEQRLVGWVVRNRVDTGYRGSTYRDVVLEPLQFSAFNTANPRRAHILSLNQTSSNDAWRQALSIAYQVYRGHPSDRPFAIQTRHFYSPISMKDEAAPPWAKRAVPLDSRELGVDATRFLFYDAIDESADPFLTLAQRPSDRIEEFQEETRPTPPQTRRSSLRTRIRPGASGRVPRPARPHIRGTQPARK